MLWLLTTVVVCRTHRRSQRLSGYLSIIRGSFFFQSMSAKTELDHNVALNGPRAGV
jgi:hypothetical protein